MELFIGCSSSNNIPEKYLEECEKYLEEIFIKGNNLIFGASNGGLMGLSYRLAKEYKRIVTGVCPIAYKDDLRDLNCENTILTKSISERTDSLIDKCDALIFLPGGIGTVYEFFAALEGKRNQEFDKPIVIYNAGGYFDKLFDFLEVVYGEKFTSFEVKDNYYFSDSAEDTLNYIKSYLK